MLSRYCPSPPVDLNIPGQNSRAIATLPARFAAFSGAMLFVYPLLLSVSILRAVFLRTTKGRPSKILAKGTYNNVHVPDRHYPSQLVFDKPLDEPSLRSALLGLCAEEGITENQVDLTFVDTVPAGWPAGGAVRKR